MDDWTLDPETGRSNSSADYKRLVGVVQRIISGSAHDLLAGRHETVARVILSRLAHSEGLAPTASSTKLLNREDTR